MTIITTTFTERMNGLIGLVNKISPEEVIEAMELDFDYWILKTAKRIASDSHWFVEDVKGFIMDRVEHFFHEGLIAGEPAHWGLRI